MISTTRSDTVRFSPHVIAILQALLVTLLWSASWVFIKIGLRENVPPVTFAGLRYSIAAACLFPFILINPTLRAHYRRMTPRHWAGLTILGLIYYTATQGLQYVALAVLPAATLTLLLSMTPLVVGLASSWSLKESLSAPQWIGIIIMLVGTAVYFFPIDLPREQLIGVGWGVLALLANGTSALLGRRINQGSFPPLVVTATSMGIGAVVMVAIGLATEGVPVLSAQTWLITIMLAVVNTAIAFTLWNHTLRTLTAVESSVINNTMTVQIAILALVFLWETLTWQQIGGLGLAIVGVMAVQLGRQKG